jgi:hypothetical protein
VKYAEARSLVVVFRLGGMSAAEAAFYLSRIDRAEQAKIECPSFGELEALWHKHNTPEPTP